MDRIIVIKPSIAYYTVLVILISMVVGFSHGQTQPSLTLIDQELIVTDSLDISESLVIINSSIIFMTDNVTLSNCSVTVMGDFNITSAVGPLNITINDIITNNTYNQLNRLFMSDIILTIHNNSLYVQDLIVDMSNGTNQLWLPSYLFISYSTLLPNNTIIFNQGTIFNMYSTSLHAFSINGTDISTYRPSVQITSTIENSNVFQSFLPLGIIPNRWSFSHQDLCRFILFDRLEIANGTFDLQDKYLNISDCRIILSGIDLQGGTMDIKTSVWDLMMQEVPVRNTTINLLGGITVIYSQPVSWNVNFATFGMIYLRNGARLNFVSANVTFVINVYTRSIYMMPIVIPGMGYYTQFTMITSDESGINCGAVHKQQFIKPGVPQDFKYIIQKIAGAAPASSINGTSICSQQTMSTRYYFSGTAEDTNYQECPDGQIMCYVIGTGCVNSTVGCGIQCGAPVAETLPMEPPGFARSLLTITQGQVTEKPVCWNGLCVENVTECIPYPACEVNKPVRCAGICVEFGQVCPPCNFSCEHGCSNITQDCQPYNGCGLGEYQCPNSLACVPLISNYTLLDESCQEYGQQRILNSARNQHTVASLTPYSNSFIPVWQMDPVEELLFYSKLQIQLPKGTLPQNATVSVVAPFADSQARSVIPQSHRFNYFKDVVISPFSISVKNYSSIQFNNGESVFISVDGNNILPKYNISDLCLAFVNESTSAWQCTPTPLEVINGTTIVGKTTHFTKFTILVQYKDSNQKDESSSSSNSKDRISARTLSIIVGTTVGGIVAVVSVAAFIVNYSLKHGTISFKKWGPKRSRSDTDGDGNLEETRHFEKKIVYTQY